MVMNPTESRGESMKIAVLGTGMIGNAVVRELVQSTYVDEVVAVDALESNLERCLTYGQSSKITAEKASLSSLESLVAILSKVDLGIACLPHSLSMLATEAAIAAGCNLLDL